MPENTARAVAPVEAAPGVTVHPGADLRLAVAQWLSVTRPDQHQVWEEWRQHRVALLPMGILISAVRLPARLVEALVGTDNPVTIDRWLSDTLEGPVICDRRGRRYYALVPPSMPATGEWPTEMWQGAEAEYLGRGTFLGVPQVQAVATDRTQYPDSYWSVPMESPGVFCEPLAVARVVAAGAYRLRLADSEESDAELS